MYHVFCVLLCAGVSGRDFAMIRDHLPEEYSRLILGATVFARMLPDQKAQLIEDLKDMVSHMHAVAAHVHACVLVC